MNGENVTKLPQEEKCCLNCDNLAHPTCVKERIVASYYINPVDANDLRRKYVCSSWKKATAYFREGRCLTL